MYETVLIAGHGGQGVLFAGRVLAQAALDAGYFTTYFPSYGAEIRGGTANCTVIISDEEIGSPIVTRWKNLILLNNPSFEKFKDCGLEQHFCIVNSSLVEAVPKCSEEECISAPLTEICKKDFDDSKYTNIVALGVFIKSSSLLPMKTVEESLRKVLSAKKGLVEINIKALNTGAECK